MINLPNAKPSFVHCTWPAKFVTSQLNNASEPSSTCKSCGVTRNFCCCAITVCSAVITNLGAKQNGMKMLVKIQLEFRYSDFSVRRQCTHLVWMKFISVKLSNVCVDSVVYSRGIKTKFFTAIFIHSAKRCWSHSMRVLYVFVHCRRNYSAKRRQTQPNKMYQVNCKRPEIVCECKAESKTLFCCAIPRNESAKTIPKNFQLLTKI